MHTDVVTEIAITAASSNTTAGGAVSAITVAVATAFATASTVVEMLLLRCYFLQEYYMSFP